MKKRYIILEGDATNYEVKSGGYSLNLVSKEFTSLKEAKKEFNKLVREAKEYCYAENDILSLEKIYIAENEEEETEAEELNSLDTIILFKVINLKG